MKLESDHPKEPTHTPIPDEKRAVAAAERLLIGGRYSNGDCQLVALMIAYVIEGGIIDGMVSFESRDPMWHCLARDNKGQYYDPLSEDWDEQPTLYMLRSYVEEGEVLRELEVFARGVDFIQHAIYFLLSWTNASTSSIASK